MTTICQVQSPADLLGSARVGSPYLRSASEKMWCSKLPYFIS